MGYTSYDFYRQKYFGESVSETEFPKWNEKASDKLDFLTSGTNQENAAYPSGLCAERTTLFYANSQYPDQPVVTLAIAARTEKDFIDHPIPPCGACRQVILETEKRYKQPIRILLYGKECIYEVKSIGDLLPLSFDASAMED